MWNFISLWEATRAKKLFIIYPVTRAYSNCLIYSITWVSRRICHVPPPVSPQSLSYFCNEPLRQFRLVFHKILLKLGHGRVTCHILEHEDQTQGISYPFHPQDRPARNFYTKYQLGYFIIFIIQHFQGYLKAIKGSEGNCYFYHVSKQINLDSETLSVRPPLLLALWLLREIGNYFLLSVSPL